MISREDCINKFVELGKLFTADNEELSACIQRTYVENNWLIEDNYWQAIREWKTKLTQDSLLAFAQNYTWSTSPKKVGIIMAGNIPMVGFHDLLCVLLSGHAANIKPSSDDKYVMLYITRILASLGLEDKITVVERLDKIDAVIATGSNNSFRYFEHYFKHIPNLLRKNRKSLAILDGTETDEQLKDLADDVFQYFGLGCRNVSLLFLPKSLDITRVLDNFMQYADLSNHNKFANNYTYHKALLLMNTEQHLDTGFLLPKERLELNAPLACINYAFYESDTEIESF
ncbi:MAG: acyl-CoA reductase-like NAD-dependent aldehyde dehydrogenase, partial [Bacteroidia bacterium]